jgi:hypothetical protein
MPNALGAKQTLGFKPQAVAGTAETTVTTFLPTENFGMNAKPTHIVRKSFIGTGRNLPMRQGYTKPEGKCLCEVMASTPHPWYWALGNVVSSQPASGTDPTVYLHTITDTDPVNLTGEGDKVYAKSRQADVKINKITLLGQVGEVAHLQIEWFALTHVEGATFTSTPVYTTDVLTVRSATIKIAGSADTTIDNFEISFDNKLDAPPTIEAASGAPHVIRSKEAPDATGKIKFIDFPTAELTRLIGASQFALVVELDGDVISHAYQKFLRVTLPACQYTGGFDNDIAEAVVTGEGNFAAFYDTATSRQILVEAQNTIATINT